MSSIIVSNAYCLVIIDLIITLTLLQSLIELGNYLKLFPYIFLNNKKFKLNWIIKLLFYLVYFHLCSEYLSFYFGKMYTFGGNKSFYTADHLHLNQSAIASAASAAFCHTSRNITRLPYSPAVLQFNASFLESNTTNGTQSSDVIVGAGNSSHELSFYHYLFRTSFAWYPFIGLSVCFLVLFIMSSIRFLTNKIVSKCLKWRYRWMPIKFLYFFLFRLCL